MKLDDNFEGVQQIPFWIVILVWQSVGKSEYFMEILHILEKDAVKSVVIQAMIKEKRKDYFNTYRCSQHNYYSITSN